MFRNTLYHLFPVMLFWKYQSWMLWLVHWKIWKHFVKSFVVPWREEALFFTIFFPAGKAFSKLQKHDQPIKKPFYVTGLFLYPWEHEKNRVFSEIFRGNGNRSVAWNGLMCWTIWWMCSKLSKSGNVFLVSLLFAQ